MDYLWYLSLLAVASMSLPNVLTYNLIFGKAKILHFGPIAVSIVTTYAMFITLMATGSYPIAIITGLAGSALISGFFAWLSLRLEGDALGILSIALHLALLVLVLNWTSVTGGALGIAKIPRLPLLDSLPAFALAAFSATALWAAVIWWIDRGPLGRALCALSEHPWHAGALGIDRKRAHLIVFLLGGISAVIANLFYTQYLHLLYPSNFPFSDVIFFIMIVVAGMPGNFWGTIVSFLCLMLLRESLRFFKIPLLTAGGWSLQYIPANILGPARLLIFGVILLAAVWWRRDSLFPKKRTI